MRVGSYNMEKLDKKSRELLAYLNANVELSAATLAEVFNQHYKTTIEDALAMLSFLESRDFVKTKFTKIDKNDKYATPIMIQITHLGRTYEQNLQEAEKAYRRKIWSERRWNIITLLLSTIITILINIFMGG